MEKTPFQWNPDPAPESPPEPNPPVSATPRWTDYRWWLDLARRHFMMVVFGAILLTLFVQRLKATAADGDKAFSPPVMEVMMPAVPLPKGTPITPETLRLEPVTVRSLTKRQQVQAVQRSDIEKLTGRLRAKKLLAPNQALLWSDLELAPDPRPTGVERHHPKVYFPKEGE